MATASGKEARKFVASYRIEDGGGFRLKDFDPGDTNGLTSKKDARKTLREGIVLLSKMQEKLFAQGRRGVLLIFQAMDAAGKDGAIKHVMSGVNPQGCQVYSFKSPSAEELNHDFLWRSSQRLPERGRIGIFNRSYYEEVLAVRVHAQLLERQNLPTELVTKSIWKERFEDINAFERYATRNGITILKFFLHLSRKEQKKRFLQRLDTPAKNWKYSMADATERGFWDDYMIAYEEMIRATATKRAPWYVAPADNKWFTQLVVAAAIHDALDEMKLEFPRVDGEKRKELAAARAALQGEKET